MKRAVGVILGVYLVLALGSRLSEKLGGGTCGCADDCWCKRPGLSLLRWVFPWPHKSDHTADEKAELDPTSA